MKLPGFLKFGVKTPTLVPENSPQVKGKRWAKFERVTPVLVKGAYVCPNCYGSQFLEGPSGGASTNVECTKCHLRWNANPLGFDWEYIGTADD